VPAISAAQDAGTTTTTEPLNPAPADASPDAPPAEASAGDLSPITESAVRDSSRGSVGVPAAAPSDAASAKSSPKARKSASGSVSIGDNFYSPASVTVTAGDDVTWSNNGQATHSATADDGSFDTGVFGPGGSRSVTFDSPGTFSYYCTVHGQSQSGTVRVLAAAGGGAGGGGGGASGSTGSATGDSEAAAVASPDAAGDANTLPRTGMASGALALVGAVLIASGLATRVAGRWLSIL
jgi:plastocyanin